MENETNSTIRIETFFIDIRPQRKCEVANSKLVAI
jgi:hypothetical protein